MVRFIHIWVSVPDLPTPETSGIVEDHNTTRAQSIPAIHGLQAAKGASAHETFPVRRLGGFFPAGIQPLPYLLGLPHWQADSLPRRLLGSPGEGKGIPYIRS